MSQDCFVKLGLSDKNICFCPIFRFEQKPAVIDAEQKTTAQKI
jgi:hypothetical protein